MEKAEVCLPSLTETFTAGFMVACVQQCMLYVCMYISLHVQTGITRGRSCSREGSAEAETLLGEEEPYQNNTTTAPALSSSPRVGYTTNC